MGTTELAWTVVPRRVDGDLLLINLHVGFHLRTATPGIDETLRDFPPALSWPPDPAPTFDVTFTQGAATTSVGQVGVAPIFDPARWADVFDETTVVQDFRQRDLRDRRIHTMPASKITGALQQIYTEAFPLGTDQLPPLQQLRQVAGLAQTTFRANGLDLRDPTIDDEGGAQRHAAAAAQLEQALAAAGVVDTSQPSDTAFDFFQLLDYYRPVRDLGQFDAPPTLSRITFQEALAGFNAEPSLQRLLGLVFELDPIPLDALTRVGIGAGTVDVSARHTGPRQLSTVPSLAPRTRSDLDPAAAVFRPRPRDPVNGPIADGHLRLDQTGAYHVSQCDPTDGIKVSDAAGSLQEEDAQLPDGTKADQGLPPLRSGLFVSQNAAAADMKAKIDAAPPAPGGLDGMIVFADDLVRGVVTDIQLRGTWRQESLRSTTFTFPSTPQVGPFDEEVHVGRGATEPIDDPGALNIGEVIYPWEGAPLGITVGKVLNIDPTDPTVVDPPTNTSAAPEIPIGISHGRPLATRRFTRLLCGEEYRFRMRVRYVDGSGVTFDEADDAHASPPTAYLRTEPVTHAVLYPTRPTVPAEGPTVVVLRGNFDTEPEHPFTDRVAFASRSTFEQVLRTRVLDVPDPNDPSKTVIDKASFALFAQRDGFLMAQHPAAQPMPNRPGDVYLDPAAATIDTRHLPDPLHDAMALRLEPSFERPAPFVSEFAFSGAYPSPTPLRLRLVPSDSLRDPDRSGDVVSVYLRPGETVHGWHAAGVDGAFLDKLALLQWARDGLPLSASELEDLEKAVDQGRHTAISPPEPLTLVYAVRQPLKPATYTPITSVSRPPGGTHAELRGEVDFSRRSTDRVDVDIEWIECVDRGPGTPAPSEVPMVRASATTVNIDHGLDNDPESQSLHGRRIEFGDTLHRDLLAGTTATSRYPQHFVEQLRTTVDPDTTDTIQLDTGTPAQGLVRGHTKVTVARISMEGRPVEEVLKRIEPVDSADPARGTTAGHYAVDHDTGTITFRTRAQMDADALFVPADDAVFTITYLVPPITRVQPRDFPIDVPSSARPAAPEVRYVIPTFGWSTGTDDGATTSTRSGAGLRVYLERPWWSSGCGEQLGVLVWAQQSGTLLGADLDQNNPISPYVTQWGADPLFRGEGLPGLYPRREHFTNRIPNTGATYRVDGTPPGSTAAAHTVRVAGHDVAYDPGSDCWYADIEIDQGSAYTPFIRMALARYQPSSIGGAHLSPVVLAEFAQLAPDRFASVTVDPADPRRLTVSLQGPSAAECDDEARSIAQVTVEERRPGAVADDELSWTPVTNPIRLAASGGDDLGIHSGVIVLPQTPGPQEWRIVFEEFESHGIEPFTAGGTPGVRGRLTHLDTLVVTAGGSGPGEATVGDGPHGPAPVFEPAQEVPPGLEHLEIYEVEFQPSQFGPDPVVNILQTSLGDVEMAFFDLAEQPQFQGDGPRRAQLEVLCSPGVLPVPEGVFAASSVDITAQGITFSRVEVRMPRREPAPLRGGMGPRMFHLTDAGALEDVTVDVGPDFVRGAATSLSSFMVGEYVGLQRLAGANRIDTAADIAAATFETGVEAVFLATAGNFPDALAAGPLAAAVGGPILLVDNGMPEATAEQIARLEPAEIVILGGTAAVSAEVESAVASRFPGPPIRRLAGPSRFATATAISAEAFPAGARVAYVATGGAFPDALSGGAAAVRDGAPLLLVNQGSVPPETEAELVRLSPRRIVVLGGTAAVSDAVAMQLEEVTGATVQRLAGPDRFATSAAIASTFDPGSPVFIATGGAFPDALAGTPVAGLLGAAMLLVGTDEVPPVVAAELDRLRPSNIVILGGTAAVSAAVEEQLAGALLR